MASSAFKYDIAAPFVTEAPPAEMPAVHALLAILEGEGVEHMFCVPGGPLTSLFEAMHQRQTIRPVVAKHEGGAAFMAAANARTRGRLAVCCVTSGPGATNALTGIASAYADSIPVLLLTGQVATHVFGKGAIQESTVYGVDIVEIFRPVTKLSTTLSSVERAPDILRDAIRTALSGRQGPVHISLPADILARPVQYTRTVPASDRRPAAPTDSAEIAKVASLLARAKHPCILAGHGVAMSHASNALLELARAMHIPVATSPKGKGTFPENDALSLGVLGFGGHDLAQKYIESDKLDVLLVVGSSMNEWVTNAWTLGIRPTLALAQIDIDEKVIGRNYPVDVAMVGDANASLRELVAQTREWVAHRPLRGDPLRALRRIAERPWVPPLSDDGSPLKPQHVIREMRRAMPDTAQLFVDNGNSILWATQYFEARRPNTYFVDLGLASMGSAVAGIVGGALGAPRQLSVALVGDAAFAMNGVEVHTAVEQRLPIVWVVLNNGGHGMVSQGEKLMKGMNFGTSRFTVPLDVAAMARAVGARGVRAETTRQFRNALAEALRADGPTVIDTVVDPEEVPTSLIRRAQSLAEFSAPRTRGPEPASGTHRVGSVARSPR
jgi:acetolactate synthase-1/2/3 large subunit